MSFFDKAVEVKKDAKGGQVFVDVNGDSTTTLTADANGKVQSISITAKGAEVGALQKMRANLQANLSGQGAVSNGSQTVTLSNTDGSLTKCDFEAIMARPEHKDLLEKMKRQGVSGHEAGPGETSYLMDVGKKPPSQSCGKGV